MILSDRGPEAGTTRLVLLGLASFMGPDGDDCFPSAEAVSRRSGVSERTVRDHLRIALRTGWLLRGRRGLEGQGWTYRYVPALPPGLEEGKVRKTYDRRTRADGTSATPEPESAETPYSPEFERFWSAYPKREGGNPKKGAWKKWQARVRNGAEPEELIAGAERYARYVEAKGDGGTEYVKMAQTFLGPAEHWREEYAVEGAGRDGGPEYGRLR